MECHSTYLTDPSQTKSATPSRPAAIICYLPHVNTTWRVCTRTVTLLSWNHDMLSNYCTLKMFSTSIYMTGVFFNIFLTVHLRIILVGNQLDAQFLLWYIYSNPLHIFEQLCAHTQEDNCMNTSSGIITLKIGEGSKITKITRIHRGSSHDIF